MDLDYTHPSLGDLRKRARRRIPHFVWEFLDSGTGEDLAYARNASALDEILFRPDVLKGEVVADLTTEFLGRSYALPFGVAPVGMSGLMWPDGEGILARTCADAQIPYCLSSMGARTPEQLKSHVGDMGWFQIYAPGNPEIRRDFLARARDSGFHTIVLTADVPAPSRRERQRRADIRQPAAITPRIALQCALHPTWTYLTLRHGRPTLAFLEKYGHVASPRPGTNHLGPDMRGVPDWGYLSALRDEWDGTLIVKGVMDPEPAKRMATMGVDALWVSNHGGRQFDAAPAAIEALPQVRDAVGPGMPLVFCSGIRSGTDILRAIAKGADFVMLGRAFHYGMGAFGETGARHVVSILKDSLLADLGQMCLSHPTEARGRLA